MQQNKRLKGRREPPGHKLCGPDCLQLQQYIHLAFRNIK